MARRSLVRYLGRVPAPLLIRPFELVPDALDWTGNWLGETIWQVLNAARDGDTDKLRAMLEDDPSLVRAEFWYTPPLHFAVREGHPDAVRLLIDAGADIFHRSLYAQETLLDVALARNHHDVANLMRDELNRRVSSTGSRQAIHEAVGNGDVDTVERLLADEPHLVNRGDHLGRRPLHYAVEAGRADLVDRLVDLGADVDASGFSSDDRLGGAGFRPVVLALWNHPYWPQRNDYAMARKLLARGARYSITIAAALGDEDRVRELLAGDSTLANDREPGGKRPLSAAAERNHVGIVKDLLDAGADPNLEEGPNCPRGFALWAAAHFGHFEVARLLLDAGADPNADVESSGTPTGTANAAMRALLYRHGGRVPLAMHSHEGNIDTVAALLDAKPELFDHHRVTECFTLAVSAGHEDLVRLLLARGLRVPAAVTGCQTYLWRTLPLARLLLEHGMDPDLPNWQQVRPLHFIAEKGDVDKARLFLEYGADPNAVDEEYRTTPLGWAARRGQSEFIRFALANGFDPRLPESPPWARPDAWARRRGHDETAKLLEAGVATGS
ncbi:MAG: ankyrin repeat domain-containing protein [Gammaproteobacteria bacterium]|nr:ankyrin repeat domain-containing protein [Gammaproteobacteria bacterium]